MSLFITKEDAKERPEEEIISGDGDPVLRYHLNPDIEELNDEAVFIVLKYLDAYKEDQKPFEDLSEFAAKSGIPESLLEKLGISKEELLAYASLRDTYSPFRMPVPLSEPRVYVDHIIGTNSTLWETLKAELNLSALPGTKQGIFPFGLGKSTYGIIYGVRAALTKAKTLCGYNVSDAVLVGDGYPLWFKLGFGGYCPVLMGSAMVAVDSKSGKVVMGLKGKYTDVPDGKGSKAVFEGQFTIPAGITDIADSVGPNKHVPFFPYNAAIANGSLRESREESGVLPLSWQDASKQSAIARSIIEAGLPSMSTGSVVSDVVTVVEKTRAKHQSLSVAYLDEEGRRIANEQMLLYRESDKKKELHMVDFYSYIDLIALGAKISIEGLAALAIARQKQIDDVLQLGRSDHRFTRQFLPI